MSSNPAPVGLCSKVGTPEDWFPPPGAEAGAEAIAVCNQCPVRLRCLEWALEQERIHPGHPHGIYGGLLPNQRATLAMGGALPTTRRHGTSAGYHRHQRAGEVACDECRLAYNARKRERRREAA